MATTASMSEVAKNVEDAELEPLTPEEAAAIGERSAAAPPLLRGRYTLKLPTLTDAVFFDRFITSYGPDGEPEMIEVDGALVPKKIKHLELVLEGGDELGLTIVKGPERIGDRVRFRASTVARNRGGKPPVRASDLGLLVVRAFGLNMPRTPAEMLTTMKKLSNKTFDATAVYVGSCNPKRDAWVQQQRLDGSTFFGPYTPDGATEPIKGCGARLYNSKFVADEAAEDEMVRRGATVICTGNPRKGINECGARVRAFVEWDAFGPAGGGK